ncbi:hypothetical protein L249_5880 [Ophiocordyceps polyrhachis-furcata BCC 54312]|uniref:Aminoglycoside phosphotransferase domain-containing protein n=1 Tax=Ophiocordyceps polyrhachis-furcata BCC 54312 TaxID=1330021 RepID=A0A367L0F9_9HYPO|nr:hypothetical protein L249_5880 [Ophiocordyceps polyrhachis-furcata BCC 54312]
MPGYRQDYKSFPPLILGDENGTAITVGSFNYMKFSNTNPSPTRSGQAAVADRESLVDGLEKLSSLDHNSGLTDLESAGGLPLQKNGESLRPNEFRTGYRGLYVPRLGKERLKNEAETLQFIQKHSDILVPIVYCYFQDDQAYYLITEYIEGVSMSELPEEKKAANLKSCRLGGLSGIVIPLYRVLQRTQTEYWYLRPSSSDEYVFCYNDLSQQNIIVDPDTLKIKAIIDWEYAGFFPPRFEYPFYIRLGPSAAISGEIDDSLDLLQFLH